MFILNEDNPVTDPLLWLAVGLMGGLVTLLLSLSSGRTSNARPDLTEASVIAGAGDDCRSRGDGESGGDGGCD